MEHHINNICDLHTHSIFSDGTVTPTAIVDEALRIGLKAVALCDHNSVDGLDEFLSAASGKNIDAVPGAEFSVFYGSKELHLLGLFIPTRFFSHITQIMREAHERKEKSNVELIASLYKAGVWLDYSAIKASTPNGKVNRAHIAAEITRKGYTSSIKEAFEVYLSPSAGYYKDPKRMTVWEALDLIRSIGAVSVLAHPFLNLTELELREFIPMAKACGLIGMECFYSLYDIKTTDLSLSICRGLELLPSGGSDFHGTNKPDIKLGLGKGNLRIPYELCLDLKSRADN